MWYLILLYVLPGIITTWLMPQFIEYQGGEEYLKFKWGDTWDNRYYKYIIAIASFTPILNLIFTFPLFLWYVCEITNKTNYGD